MTRCGAARRRSMSTISAYAATRSSSIQRVPGRVKCRIAPKTPSPTGEPRAHKGSPMSGSRAASLEDRVDRRAAGVVVDGQHHRHRVRAGQAGDSRGADLEREPVAAEGNDETLNGHVVQHLEEEKNDILLVGPFLERAR